MYFLAYLVKWNIIGNKVTNHRYASASTVESYKTKPRRRCIDFNSYCQCQCSIKPSCTLIQQLTLGSITFAQQLYIWHRRRPVSNIVRVQFQFHFWAAELRRFAPPCTVEGRAGGGCREGITPPPRGSGGCTPGKFWKFSRKNHAFWCTLDWEIYTEDWLMAATAICCLHSNNFSNWSVSNY